MSRLALEDDLDPGDADDRADHADRCGRALQHRALFDVELEERPDVVALRLRQSPGIAADRLERLGEAAPVGEGLGQQCVVEQARHRARADAGHAAIAGLFGQEVDHLEGVARRVRALGEAARDLETREHAGDAVEPPAPRHGVAVRAGHQRPRLWIRPFQPAGQVAAGIDPGVEPGLPEAPPEPVPPLREQRRERSPREGPVGFGQPGERLVVGPQARFVDARPAHAVPRDGSGLIHSPVPGPATVPPCVQIGRPRR